MYRLTLLGGLDLRGPENQPLQSVLQQPKRLALLAYLVLAGRDGFVRRDVLLALFWPESDEERARRNLNQAIHYLRRSLGEEVIVSRGAEEIGLKDGALWCDVLAFEEALDRGTGSEALALYRGDLLPGFFVDGAVEFERWLENERTRLRRQAARAAWALAELEEREGDPATALHWARRAVELDLYDEPGVRRLIELLDRTGDRAGALQVFDTFARRLAEDYGTAPSAETLRLVEEIRARVAPAELRWERPVAPPTPDLESWPALPAPAPLQPAGAPRRHPRRTVLRWALPFAALAIAVLSALAWWFADRMRPSPARPFQSAGPIRIAVLQFEDFSRDREVDYLAGALATALTNQLAEVPTLQVVSPTMLGNGHPAALNNIDATQGVDLLVSGAVLRSETEGRTRVSVQLIDAQSRATIATIAVEKAAGEVFALVDEVSREVANALRVTLGREIRFRQWRAGTENLEAWKRVQQAVAQREAARRLFRSGAEAAGMAALQDADSLLAEAEKLAPEWVDPTVLRAEVTEEMSWRYFLPPAPDSARHRALLDRALAHVEHALQREPENAAALELRGILQYFIWLSGPQEGKSPDTSILRQSEHDLRSAVAADETRARAWSTLSAILYLKGEFVRAKIAAERAYRADAYLDNVQEILGRLVDTSLEMGDREEARRWCNEIHRRFSGRWFAARCTLALLAWADSTGPNAVEDAWRAIREVRRPEEFVYARPLLEMAVATVLAKAGLRDSAEAVIRRAQTAAAADPNLLELEAAARLELGDEDSALALLASYVRSKPGTRSWALKSRRFAHLRGRPGFPTDPGFVAERLECSPETSRETPGCPPSGRVARRDGDHLQ